MIVAMSTWDGQLPACAELPDGTAIVVRELHPSDEPALRAWFATVSEASRYLRFHSHVSDLSPALWRYLTRIDGIDHTALIALHEGELVGVARMIRLDTSTAEIAFLVSDALQRRRVGSLLRDVLIAVSGAVLGSACQVVVPLMERQIVDGSSSDPAARIRELKRQRKELDRQIARRGSGSPPGRAPRASS